jgi:hypothetical protein
MVVSTGTAGPWYRATGDVFWSTSNEELLARWRFEDTYFGFGILVMPNQVGVFVPYWFLFIICVTLAIVSWPEWTKEFSLRTLLIAVTLVAVVLGLAAWAGS